MPHLLSRVLQDLRFDLALTTALLFLVSAGACLVPSMRAARLDPNQTLRQQ